MAWIFSYENSKLDLEDGNADASYSLEDLIDFVINSSSHGGPKFSLTFMFNILLLNETLTVALLRLETTVWESWSLGTDESFLRLPSLLFGDYVCDIKL